MSDSPPRKAKAKKDEEEKKPKERKEVKEGKEAKEVKTGKTVVVDPRKKQMGVVESAMDELYKYVNKILDLEEKERAMQAQFTRPGRAGTPPKGKVMLQPGQRVILQDLKSYSELNGTKATVVRWNVEVGVYAVRVDGKDADMGLKPNNLRVESGAAVRGPEGPEAFGFLRPGGRSPSPLETRLGLAAGSLGERGGRSRSPRRGQRAPSPSKGGLMPFQDEETAKKEAALKSLNAARKPSDLGLRGFDNKAPAPEPDNAAGFGQHVLRLAQVQIRCLLGRGGTTIQSIMRQTGAQIVVRSPPSAYEGVVTVSGNFQPALKLIEDLLASKGCPVTERPAMGLGDAPGIIEVPDGLIGQLIGRTAFFTEVQAKLGSETVVQRLPYTSPSGKRLVQVAGDNWLQAKDMVESWVKAFSGGRKINGYFRPSAKDESLGTLLGGCGPMGTPMMGGMTPGGMGAPSGQYLPLPPRASTWA